MSRQILAPFRNLRKCACGSSSLKGKKWTSCFLLGASVFQFGKPDFDSVDMDEERALEEQYKVRDSLTWRQRLDLMWRKDAYGNLSPELTECKRSTILGALTGFIIGSYVWSREDFRNFLISNKHEMFKHPREAQEVLRTTMYKSITFGGIHYGWRLALLTFTFVATTQSLDVMRNAVQPLDHSAVGFIMGAIFRFQGGPKAMIGAGGIGCLLGLSEGMFRWAVTKIPGCSIDERFQVALRFQQDLNKQTYEENKLKAAKAIPRSVWNPEGTDNDEHTEHMKTQEDPGWIAWVTRRIYLLIVGNPSHD